MARELGGRHFTPLENPRRRVPDVRGTHDLLAVYLNAGNDTNGNPRRGWLVIDPIRRVWWFSEEGYGGRHRLNQEFDLPVLDVLTQAILITPAQYRALQLLMRHPYDVEGMPFAQEPRIDFVGSRRPGGE